jgi:hypothetical protein
MDENEFKEINLLIKPLRIASGEFGEGLPTPH